MSDDTMQVKLECLRIAQKALDDVGGVGGDILKLAEQFYEWVYPSSNVPKQYADEAHDEAIP